jgi:D-alanyl-D-alanine carboxypeptidase
MYGNAYRVLPDAFLHTDITADSFLVFDVQNGKELGERNPTTLHEMASVVKLLTADTALSSSTIDASTTISWRAVATSGKAGRLAYGEEYRVRELVFPLLLESSNDAAEAIAEVGGRSSFIKAMNARARDIGMASTTVVDPSGLDRANASTARDLKVLLHHLFHTHRHVLDITSLRSYVGKEHVWQNNDPVFSSEGFVGGKHGYTDTAGRTIALVYETTFGPGDVPRAVGVVLLDTDDIRGDVAKVQAEVARAVEVKPRIPNKLP